MILKDGTRQSPISEIFCALLKTLIPNHSCHVGLKYPLLPLCASWVRACHYAVTARSLLMAGLIVSEVELIVQTACRRVQHSDAPNGCCYISAGRSRALFPLRRPDNDLNSWRGLPAEQVLSKMTVFLPVCGVKASWSSYVVKIARWSCKAVKMGVCDGGNKHSLDHISVPKGTCLHIPGEHQTYHSFGINL